MQQPSYSPGAQQNPLLPVLEEFCSHRPSCMLHVGILLSTDASHSWMKNSSTQVEVKSPSWDWWLGHQTERTDLICTPKGLMGCTESGSASEGSWLDCVSCHVMHCLRPVSKTAINQTQINLRHDKLLFFTISPNRGFLTLLWENELSYLWCPWAVRRDFDCFV